MKKINTIKDIHEFACLHEIMNMHHEYKSCESLVDLIRRVCPGMSEDFITKHSVTWSIPHYLLRLEDLSIFYYRTDGVFHDNIFSIKGTSKSTLKSVDEIEAELLEFLKDKDFGLKLKKGGELDLYTGKEVYEPFLFKDFSLEGINNCYKMPITRIADINNNVFSIYWDLYPYDYSPNLCDDCFDKLNSSVWGWFRLNFPLEISMLDVNYVRDFTFLDGLRGLLLGWCLYDSFSVSDSDQTKYILYELGYILGTDLRDYILYDKYSEGAKKNLDELNKILLQNGEEPITIKK